MDTVYKIVFRFEDGEYAVSIAAAEKYRRVYPEGAWVKGVRVSDSQIAPLFCFESLETARKFRKSAVKVKSTFRVEKEP